MLTYSFLDLATFKCNLLIIKLAFNYVVVPPVANLPKHWLLFNNFISISIKSSTNGIIPYLLSKIPPNLDNGIFTYIFLEAFAAYELIDVINPIYLLSISINDD